MIRIKFLNKKLIRKSNASLNTNNEQVKFEIKNTIPFIIPPQNHLGISLTKYVQNSDKELENILSKKLQNPDGGIQSRMDIQC